MRRWNQRVVVVTGAASGIGREVALAFARRGAVLVLADIQEAALEQTRAVIRAECGTEMAVHTHRVDVADRAQMEGFASDVMRRHDAIDALVNNAGITVVRRFEDSALAEIDRVLGIDLMGVIHGCHFFLPALLRAQKSHIVNMSSMIAFSGAPTQSAYCMAKSAVKALSESLRAELAPRGVGVTCVFPGTVRTALVRELNAPPIVRSLLARLDGVGIDPERVATALIDGVERNAPRVLVGSDSFLVDRVARFSPTAIPGISAVAMRLARRWL